MKEKRIPYINQDELQARHAGGERKARAMTGRVCQNRGQDSLLITVICRGHGQWGFCLLMVTFK